MRSEILELLKRNEDYFLFLRENPSFHLFLTYYPERYNEFIENYKIIRRKRFIDKVEDTANMINMINLLMGEM